MTHPFVWCSCSRFPLGGGSGLRFSDDAGILGAAPGFGNGGRGKRRDGYEGRPRIAPIRSGLLEKPIDGRATPWPSRQGIKAPPPDKGG